MPSMHIDSPSGIQTINICINSTINVQIFFFYLNTLEIVMLSLLAIVILDITLSV